MQVPDYSKYTLEELIDVLSRIEKDKYPEKVQAIEEQIKIKEALNPYFKLFGKSEIRYKNKWFIIILILILSSLGIINLANLLLSLRILPVLAFLSIAVTLFLILINHPKLVLAIKIISVLFVIVGVFGVISIVLEVAKYLLSPPDEYIFSLNVSNAITSLIIFSSGLFYFIYTDDYIIK